MDNSIRAYPNPSTGIIKIESNTEYEKIAIEVYTIVGTLVYKITTVNKLSSIDLLLIGI